MTEPGKSDEQNRITRPGERHGRYGALLRGDARVSGPHPEFRARAWRTRPYIAWFYLPFNATLQREGMGGLLTCKIKEIVVLKTSFVNACAY